MGCLAPEKKFNGYPSTRTPVYITLMLAYHLQYKTLNTKYLKIEYCLSNYMLFYQALVCQKITSFVPQVGHFCPRALKRIGK